MATASVVCAAGAAGSPAGTFVQPLAGENPAAWYEIPNAAAPACSVAFNGAARTPRVEKKLTKSTVGPLMPAFAPPTQSIWATFLPARSPAAASVSAWSVPEAEKLVRLLKFDSPVR